ncbi:chorismate synthase [Acetitomaculum ruminis DSM 5522]|uniref:Chorismate synthase n=1 Tax=Acetitomaculum ruminis DSM 5522 TaxID=1120918 RepID=A0A1I0VLS6_9FIRM|nr:chorismate synthase [Acetitomaculum ruminis]SFA77168.1 chorismate synthase [Acetitomaculum ruminis DSM 5522]
MSGSVLGNIFKISTWGESHGFGVGVVIDGVPAGLELNEEDIQIFLDRRKPGTSKFTTKRKENDLVKIMSGVFDGKTTGTPISLMVVNEDHHSKDYSEISSYYRPGHADYTFDEKYGFRDYRGGGRSSGRETIGRVAAGAIAVKILKELGIIINAYTSSIGPVSIDKSNFDMNQAKENALYMPDREAFIKAEKYLEKCIKEKNSSGGSIECIIKGLPSGVGEPCFDKLNAVLAHSICSIGAVKGFEIGDGIEASKNTGLNNNDSYYYNEKGVICKNTNHSGGITGGISEGFDIKFKAYIKPTPSIAASQNTINKSKENIQINIKGRHDPVIVPRAVVVVEAMSAITVLDMLLLSMTNQIENIKRFFTK